MQNQNCTKKYDLDIKQKEVKEFRKPSIFDESSSDEDESNKIPTLSFSSNFKKQDTSKLEKALIEDPTLYDYDSVYDQISTAKPKFTESSVKQRPKLAKLFIESAEKKNIRYQVLLSKKAKKENEIDKKDVFVTNAYKKEHEKLLQVAKEDQEQEEREKDDEILRQGGTSAIYRYMLNEKLNLNIKPVLLNPKETCKNESIEKVSKIVECQEETTSNDKSAEETSVAAEDEIISMALKAKSIREKAALLMQKPDTKYMLEKVTKKNDDSSIKMAQDRYLMRKMAKKRKVVDEDSD